MTWLHGWRTGKRIKITIDSGDVDEVLQHFPVHIYLSASSGINSDDVTAVFDEVGSSYLKIAVTKSDGATQLYVEVEKWDAVGEEAWLWVSRDSWFIDDGADTDFYLYYDSTHEDNEEFVGLPNSTVAEKVWDSNYEFVIHMRDDPDTSHVRDSTSNDKDGTKKAANQPIVTTGGKIDDAQDFDGLNTHYIDVAVIATPAFTFAAWIKEDMDQSGNIIGKYDSVTKKICQFYRDGPIDGATFDFGQVGGVRVTISTAPNSVEMGDWHYLAATYDGFGNTYLYLDGIEANSSSTTPDDFLDSWEFDIGRRAGTTPASYFYGIIDEIRMSDDDRSAAWIKACYETQRDHFLTYGSPESAKTSSRFSRFVNRLEKIRTPNKLIMDGLEARIDGHVIRMDVFTTKFDDLVKRFEKAK